MSGSKTLTALQTGLLASMLFGLVQTAAGHSYIQVPGEYILEGYSAKAYYTIVHACEESSRSTKAHSLVMPTLNPVLSRTGGGAIEDVDGSGQVDLADVLQTGSLVGVITPYVDTSVFKKRQIKVDDPNLGNAVGFSSTQGQVPSRFIAEIPMQLTSVFFVADSCVSEMVIHPVGADICKISKVPQEGDAKIWMEHPTPKFPNPVHGVGENALRIVYKRDVLTNPLPGRCGDGYGVDVYLSDEDIDAHLPIPGYWPKK